MDDRCFKLNCLACFVYCYIQAINARQDKSIATKLRNSSCKIILNKAAFAYETPKSGIKLLMISL